MHRRFPFFFHFPIATDVQQGIQLDQPRGTPYIRRPLRNWQYSTHISIDPCHRNMPHGHAFKIIDSFKAAVYCQDHRPSRTHVAFVFRMRALLSLYARIGYRD
jgi:hypothetical protein